MNCKIIQVVPCSNPDSSLILTALCDDGSVWEYFSKQGGNYGAREKVWEKITDGPDKVPAK